MIRRSFVACACVLAALASSVAVADDWSQFRGAQRDGIAAAEKGLMRSWPESGPEVLWRRPIGSGFAGISTVGDRIVTFYADPEAKGEFAAAFNASNGEEIWRTQIGELFEEQFGDGPRATPTIVDGRIFALSSRGDLHALNAKDGTVLWSHSMTEEYESTVPRFGYSASPLVEDGLVVVQVGSGKEDGHSYYAFDAKSGEQKWGALKGGAGYVSPVATTLGGVRQFVFVGQTEIFALDKAGERLWQFEWPGGTIASPLPISDGRIFVSASSDVGGVLLKISKDGDAWNVEELWRNREMKNHFSSSLVVDDKIYGFDGATFKAISLKDGSRLWAKRGLGKGSLIAADNLLFALSDKGKLVMVDANSEGFSQVGQLQAFEDKSWTAPSLQDGRLYLRSLSEMICVKVKG